jgi:hypothetical protein
VLNGQPPRKRQSTPTHRAAAGKAQVESIRRKYKLNTARRVKLLPSEVPHIEQMIVVLKLANYSRVDMARIIGISRDQVADILALPRVNEEITILRKKIPGAALELLENFMIEAVMTLIDVMRTTRDDKIRIQAAESMLDRGGISKVSKQERHQLNEERTTITDDGIVERLREASPEIQEKAAQVIEQLEALLGKAASEAASETSE